jgi:hypothetical protein
MDSAMFPNCGPRPIGAKISPEAESVTRVACAGGPGRRPRIGAVVLAVLLDACSPKQGSPRSAPSAGDATASTTPALVARNRPPASLRDPSTAPAASHPRELVTRGVAGCDLAVDATHVYFTASAPEEQGGTLARLPKAGGDIERLTPNLPWIDDFVLADGTLYFTETVEGRVLGLRVGGPPAEVLIEKPPGLAPFPGLCEELLLGPTELVWRDADELLTASTRGGAPLWLAGVPAQSPFAVDDAFVYFASEGHVMKLPHPRRSVPARGDYPWPRRPGLRFAAPEPPTHVVATPSRAKALLLDRDTLYFADTAALSATPKSASAPSSGRTLATLDQNERFVARDAQAFAVDEAYVYALVEVGTSAGTASASRPTRLVRVPKAGGAAAELGRSEALCGIAVDGDRVYAASLHLSGKNGRLGSLWRFDSPR